MKGKDMEQKVYKLTLELNEADRAILEDAAAKIFPIKVSKSRLAAMWVKEKLKEYRNEHVETPPVNVEST